MPSKTPQKSMAITRPVGQGEETRKSVWKLGWTLFLVHTVELRPLERSDIFDRFSRIVNDGPVDWLVFLSTVGVNSFFDTLESHSNILSSGLGQLRIMAVGPRTCEALKNHRVRDVVVPETYTSSAIADKLSQFNLQGQRIVLIRSSAADRRLASILESRGATVETMVTYKATIPEDRENTQEFLAGLEKGEFHAVLFTSATSTSNLFSMAEREIPAARFMELLRLRLVGAIGPTTAAKLRQFGIDPLIPRRYLIEDAIELMVEKYENNSTEQALVASK